jgi:hypothetical protein
MKQRINTRSCGNKLTRLGAGKLFASSPRLAESLEQIDFSSAGEASGEYQNDLSRFFIRHQGNSFLPRSSLRALSDPTLNVEGGIGRNENLNVERGVGRECRAINRRAEGWRSGLKGPDDVSEVEREHRPDEPRKAP